MNDRDMKTVANSLLQTISTPAVIVDWEQVTKNVEQLANQAKERGVRIMPHVKTHKSVKIAKLQLDAGAYGLTCAKISEAKAMIPSGVKRVFLAHSLVTRVKVEALLELAEELDELILAATSLEQAKCLAALLEPFGRVFPCLLAIDSGLGREGCRTSEELIQLKAFVDGVSAFEYRGIYTHEGYTYGSSPDEIAEEARKVARLLVDSRDAIGGEGELWPGCSVTARMMINQEGVTGIRPGAYVFGDQFLTLMTEAMDWGDVSLVVASTVVDKPRPGLALIDAGSKVFSSDRLGQHPFAIPLDGRDFEVTRLSEEHAFLTGTDVVSLEIGEVVLFVPQHVCPVVNLTDQMIALSKDGEPEALPVDARGCVY
tara:strand:+ start:3825 stop:4937 length:1113 start_codon:yes stop_codon:yes gene_type:complete